MKRRIFELMYYSLDKVWGKNLIGRWCDIYKYVINSRVNAHYEYTVQQKS